MIGFELKTLSNLVKRKVQRSTLTNEFDRLTGTHGWVIGYLCRNRDKEIFQRDLETRFSIRRSTATGILQLMEKNGLLIREPVPYDARLKKLVLTPKAIELHEAFQREIEKTEHQLVKGLTEQEIKHFLVILEKMKKNVE